MNATRTFLAMLLVLGTLQRLASAGDWMTWRSTYTHDRATGQRVDQYAPPVDPVGPDRGNLVRSGYRHYRSSIQVGESADNLHIVSEYGRPVVPYESWRFPFRPYGAPYDAWGPQTPNVLSNTMIGNFGNSGGYRGGHHPDRPGPGPGPGPSPAPASGEVAAMGAAADGPAARYASPGYSGYGPGGYGPGGYGYPGGVPYSGGYGYQGGYGYPSSGFPLVPPYQPAPWNDGFYPAAPPLDGMPDPKFFYIPPEARIGPWPRPGGSSDSTGSY